MGMSIDDAIRDLVYLKGCGIFPFNYGTDAKQLTIATDECITVAVDIMRKYQMFQLDYEKCLKADMVAMLEELKQDLIAEAYGIEMFGDDLAVDVPDIDKIIQQKINAIEENTDGTNTD